MAFAGKDFLTLFSDSQDVWLKSLFFNSNRLSKSAVETFWVFFIQGLIGLGIIPEWKRSPGSLPETQS
ncbi:MAG: hypothetical protein Ct9H300mP28_22100 [Pseudomonadota bacterium]|nr:MAG: hypothetical protein Ct9H300mP28_22100 [Pseudomonadota bacterium]